MSPCHSCCHYKKKRTLMLCMSSLWLSLPFLLSPQLFVQTGKVERKRAGTIMVQTLFVESYWKCTHTIEINASSNGTTIAKTHYSKNSKGKLKRNKTKDWYTGRNIDKEEHRKAKKKGNKERKKHNNECNVQIGQSKWQKPRGSSRRTDQRQMRKASRIKGY